MSLISEFHLAGILLAAGRGSRFDPSGARNKLLAELPDRQQVLRASALALLPHVEDLYVITPNSNPQFRDALEGIRVTWVVNPRADDGMGCSIAAGARALDGASACLVALGDMPFIHASTYGALRIALQHGAEVVAPSYHGARGHPVGFSCHHFAALASLQGDRGAKSLLDSPVFQNVVVDDSGILRDIDRPQDLLAL